MHTRVAVLFIAVTATIPAKAQNSLAPLALEAKISLGSVSGRIDHLAVDLKRQRLFVAELGNGSLGVVNLAAAKVLRTISGFSEPQGVGYEPATDNVYVANASDGSVRILRGEDLAAIGRIDLGGDADNVRIDAARQRVLVGYGTGALAIIDPSTRTKIGDIRLKAHPESFQIDGDRAFVNVPDARLIEVVDLTKAEVVGAWPTQPNHSNFPMALDQAMHRVVVVFRSPARLVIMSAVDGSVVSDVDTCGDADDVFLDKQRHRVYVVCGAGVVDIFEGHAGSYQRIAQTPTAPGARTALFVPEMDRLFVAVRGAGAEPAAIWVFRPTP